MPKFVYFCTALLDIDGRSQSHEIDVPKKRVDAYDPPVPSKMGNLESRRGQPPAAVFCEEHRGWATLAPLQLPHVTL